MIILKYADLCLSADSEIVRKFWLNPIEYGKQVCHGKCYLYSCKAGYSGETCEKTDVEGIQQAVKSNVAQEISNGDSGIGAKVLESIEKNFGNDMNSHVDRLDKEDDQLEEHLLISSAVSGGLFLVLIVGMIIMCALYSRLKNTVMNMRLPTR